MNFYSLAGRIEHGALICFRAFLQRHLWPTPLDCSLEASHLHAMSIFLNASQHATVIRSFIGPRPENAHASSVVFDLTALQIVHSAAACACTEVA